MEELATRQQGAQPPGHAFPSLPSRRQYFCPVPLAPILPPSPQDQPGNRELHSRTPLAPPPFALAMRGSSPVTASPLLLLLSPVPPLAMHAQRLSHTRPLRRKPAPAAGAFANRHH